MQLDATTAALCALASRTTLAGILVLYSRWQKTYEGFHWWAAGACMATLGLLGLLLRPLGPGLSIFMANGFSLLAWTLTLDGTLRFLRVGRLAPGWYALPAAVATAQVFQPDLGLRQMVWTAAVSGLLARHCSLLWLHAPAEARTLYRSFAAAGLFVVLCLGLRMALWGNRPPTQEPATFGPREVPFFLLLMLVDLWALAGFLLLNSQRLGAELQASEAQVRRSVEEVQATRAQVKVLSGLLPICANCKDIRDAHGGWHRFEEYVQAHTGAEPEQALCPACQERASPGC